MAFPQHVWSQIKNITAGELVKALERDGWIEDPDSHASVLVYITTASPRKRVAIHFHPQKTYGAKLLTQLLNDIGWSEADLKRLKLIK